LTNQTQALIDSTERHCPLRGKHPTIKTIRAVSYAAKDNDQLSTPMEQTEYPSEITVNEARQLLQPTPPQALIIDVREPYEVQICQLAGARHIPMRQLPAQLDELPRDQHLLIMCHHGSRSQAVTGYLRAQGFAKVSNIAGGINAWAMEIDPTLARY